MRLTVILAAAVAAGATALPAFAQEAPTIPSKAQAEAPKEDTAKEQKVASGDFERSDHVQRERFGDKVPAAWKRAQVDDTVTGSTRSDSAKSGSRNAGAASSGGHYSAVISQYASAYGVPVALANAVVRIESNYRPNARGSAGEVGLMQIKPTTARFVGYTGSSKGLFDPETNIKYGMKYLAMAHKLGGGTTCGTVLKYNAGHAAKSMNGISAAYCAKVKRYMTSGSS